MNRLASPCVGVTALCCAALAPAGDPPITLESLRAEHAAHAAALRTLIVEEDVQTRLAAGGLEARVRERLEDRLEAQRQRFYEAVDCSEDSAEALLLAEQRFDAAHDAHQVEGRLAAFAANARQSSRQRAAFDFVAQRVRIEQRDLRDLDALAERFAVPARERVNLDCTRTVISTAGYSLLVNRDESLATVSTGSTRPLTERLVLLGIVPERLLDGRYPTRVTREADGSILLRAQRPDMDGLAFEIVLRPDEGRYATRITRYDRAGARLHELHAADYRRLAPGMSAPFFTETFERLSGQAGVRSVSRMVTRVQVNPDAPAALFEAPRTARVQPLDASARAAYVSRDRGAQPK